MTSTPGTHQLPLKRLSLVSLLIGLAAIILCAAGYLFNERQFYQSYLFAYVYWWTISVGCLGLSLMYQMTGGGWGYAARPLFDSGVRTLPLVAVAFVPVALGMNYLYVWMQPDYFAGDPHAQNRQWFLQPNFFLARTIAGFAICIVLGWILTRRRAQADGAMAGELRPTVGGLGAVLVVNVVTLGAVDWTMTLQPLYFSTIYGAIFVGGALLCGMCLSAAGVALGIRASGRRGERAITAMHDVGKLLLAMVMLWAYLSFSQFMITYSGNLPYSSQWFLDRLQGGWQWLGGSLIVLHFAIPFLLLISRTVKRTPVVLATVAIGLAAIHAVEVFWTIAPSFHGSQFHVHWLDAAALVAIGGIWLAEFFRQLNDRLIPILPHWPYPGAADD